MVGPGAAGSGKNQRNGASLSGPGLIWLCAEFDAIERKHYAVFLAAPDNSDAQNAAMEAMDDEHAPLLEQITALAPTTFEGAAALAGTLHQWTHGDFARGKTTEERLARTLVAELAKSAPNAGTLSLEHVSPDAALIALCDEVGIHRDRVNRKSTFDMDACPDWAAYTRCADAITEAKSRTLAGMVAKAQAAQLDAKAPDGSEDPAGTVAERWAWDLVQDLARLGGRA